MKLIVGTNSTWSLRAWICLQLLDIEVKELVIDMSSGNYKEKIYQYSPTGLVPILINNFTIIHDSLAIAEYLNDINQGRLYPKNIHERAIARSLCAELHSGFNAIKSKCPFTLDSEVKPVELSKNLPIELTRVEDIFSQAKLPYMFDSASVVDAFYAVLAYRLNSYGVSLNGRAGAYQQSLLNWHILNNAIVKAKQWTQQ